MIDALTIRTIVREELQTALAGTCRPMTAAEACEYLGVSRRTLNRMMKTGAIRGRQIPGRAGRLYFFRNELNQSLKGTIR